MNTVPTLRDLQLWMQWIITDPRGVRVALHDPTPNSGAPINRYTQPTRSFLDYIHDVSSDETTRLDIYAEGYFSRILESLSKDFGRTKLAVGDGTFTTLVAEYLKRHPSKVTSIDEVGRDFPSFLSESCESAGVPWAGELAQFEWGLLATFYANDVPYEATALQNDLGEDVCIDFRVHPSLTCFRFHWPVSQIIDSLDAGLAIEEVLPQEGHCHLILYRSGHDSVWEVLEPSLFDILQKLKEGRPLEDVFAPCHQLESHVITENFRKWVEMGVLVSAP